MSNGERTSITNRIRSSVNGGTAGRVLEISRPLAKANQQVVVVVEGRDGNIDEQAIENEVENAQNDDVTVTVRQARLTGSKDIVVATRGGVLEKDQIGEIVTAVGNELNNQDLGLSVSTWRIEA